MSDRLNLIYATDDGYLTPTLVSIASALVWASDRAALNIVVLDVGIADDRWSDFERMLRETYGAAFGLWRVVVDVTQYAGFKAYRGSLGTYARLDIPQLFPDWDWCVYADGDTLFTEDPLKLRGVYDSRFAIQGQDDSENWGIENGTSPKQQWFERKGLGWDGSQYVCAGFLLMNLDWFRANNATKKCMDFLRTYPDCQNHDQDALSYVCRGHIAMLPPAWGCLSRNAFRDGRPACIHYAADAPWNLPTSCRRDFNDAHKLWFDFATRLQLDKTGQTFFANFSSSAARYSFANLHSHPSFRRKCIVRIVCKFLFPFFSLFNFPTPIGHYLRKHYTSRTEYTTLLK